MALKRVVVTGIGALTPIGNTAPEYWEGLKSGKSGSAAITRFNAEKFKTRFACEVKNFDVLNFIDRKEARKMEGLGDEVCISFIGSIQPRHEPLREDG